MAWAAGEYPLDAVAMTDRVIKRVKMDSAYRAGIEAAHTPAESTTAEATRCASSLA